MAKVDGFAAGAPSWVDLMSPDPEKARKFYKALFGWEFAIGGPETGHYAMAMKGDRMVAGVGGMPPGQSMPSVWTLYFDTKNIDASLAQVKKLGGTVMQGAMDVMDAGRLAVAVDPTGAVFGMWQPGTHKGAGVIDEPGAMAWRELATRDVPRAKDFYAGLFDLAWEKYPAGDFEYWVYKRGGGPVAGMMHLSPQLPAEMPAHWLNYFAVENTDKACETVTHEGGKVIQPAFDTPHGRMSVVSDPFGAVFAIIQSPGA